MECKNSVLDDLCPVVGYTATTVLAAWYGGTELYVPAEFKPDHILSKLLGDSAAKRLIAEYPAQYVFIPKNSIATRYSRWRIIRDTILAGGNTRAICQAAGISVGGACKIRRILEAKGFVPVILTAPKQNAD